MEGQIHGGTELGMFAPLKSMFAKRLTLQVRHSELGVLVYCCGIWFGTVQRRGRKVHFTVAGTDSAPDRSRTDVLANHKVVVRHPW